MIEIIIYALLGAFVGFIFCLNVWLYLETKKFEDEVNELINI
jgi:hypothetical protein